jgi:hypothetical protein
MYTPQAADAVTKSRDEAIFMIGGEIRKDAPDISIQENQKDCCALPSLDTFFPIHYPLLHFARGVHLLAE